MLDCYGCDKDKLGNPNFILKFLRETPNKLDMHIIKEPSIVSYDYNPETWDNGGVSAIVIIAESHISIHTFPNNDGFMSIDMFSCKEFDIEKVISIINKEFHPKMIEKNLIMRGTHFPKEEYKLQKIIESQRKNLDKNQEEN